jgi:hypothetical protein
MTIISLVGALVGVEFTLRTIDYLYTRKSFSVGSHKKHKRTKTYTEKIGTQIKKN